MTPKQLKPDYVFEASWEVCNKVGGIFTVLSSRAQTLAADYADRLVFVGPDLWQDALNPDFREDAFLLSAWRSAAAEAGVPVRIGRWVAAGGAVAVLVDFKPFMARKNAIYAWAWERFGVDSLHAYGDYDEASMFAYAAGCFVEAVCRRCLPADAKTVFQAHEWMSGLGLLRVKEAVPAVGTIFTTHATSVGRSITTNNKLLYKYFPGYEGDQMARELNMEAKHSVEKQAAWHADCFTTVSAFTDVECRQLLGKPADMVLPNGFDSAIVPRGAAFTAKRRAARGRVLRVASALLGERLPADTLIVSTSGRNDYRCKGYDVFLQALAELEGQWQGPGGVLALIEVPCWVRQPRADLAATLSSNIPPERPLPEPFITHELHNFGDDRIVGTLKKLGLTNSAGSRVKVMLVPCYLDGRDGIVDLSYYDLLPANDLCVYPSYYEPWGYTPLEACAFRTPCVTTDLSGFGQWVNDTLGRSGTLADGVDVVHRDDDNYADVVRHIVAAIRQLHVLSPSTRAALRQRAATVADAAQWKRFISHYYEAYHFALNKKQNDRQQ